MTLVDTSAWIDLLSGRTLSYVARFEKLVDDEDAITICGVVLTECLQGIDDDLTHRRVQRQLADVISLPLLEKTFVAAADFYRILRRKGITIRKTNDCIIAASAIEHGCALLHNDQDFDAIAKHLR